MHKYFISLINVVAGCILLSANCFSQAPSIEWQNDIGGTSFDDCTIIQQTTDGGYIIGGGSRSGISGDKTESEVGIYEDYWIIKLNAAGSIEWQNTIGGISADIFSFIVQTSDNGFFVGGYSSSGIGGDKTETNIGDQDYWVVKLDASGNIEWQNTIGGTAADYLESGVQTTDGGYIIAGYSRSGISGDKTEPLIGGVGSDYWIIKLNATGSIEWQKTIGGNSEDEAYSVIQTIDGGYLVGGYSSSGVSGDKTEPAWDIVGVVTEDYWIIKLSSTGSIEWQNTIGGDDHDYLTSVEQTSDGGYFIAGYSYSGLVGDKTEINRDPAPTYTPDYWVLKLNSEGNILWQKTIGGYLSDKLHSAKQTMDGGYILSGSSGSFASGDKTETLIGLSAKEDIWIIKIDNAGNIVWQNDIGGSDTDLGFGVDQTTDGGYAVAANSYSPISGDKTEANWDITSPYSSDYWIIKLFPDCIPSPEICNSLDDNCNGLIDDGITETISISAAGPTTFCQGGSVVLTASYSGATVQWKKDGVNIAGATSSNYTVTKKGNYTCVTTSACGSAESSGIYVTVNKNPNASISAGGPTTFCTGGSVTLSEIASPGCTYQWYKGAMAIAGATTTNYIATTAGNYKCRVTKTATGCYKNSNAIAVSVPCREGEGAVVTGEPGFMIYPNPAIDKLFISFSSLTTHNSPLLTDHSSLIITDIAGKIIFTSELNSPTTEINISNFAIGMYFVKIKINDKEMIEKFIKD